MVYNHKQFADVATKDCYKVEIFDFDQEKVTKATEKETNGFLT